MTGAIRKEIYGDMTQWCWTNDQQKLAAAPDEDVIWCENQDELIAILLQRYPSTPEIDYINLDDISPRYRATGWVKPLPLERLYELAKTNGAVNLINNYHKFPKPLPQGFWIYGDELRYSEKRLKRDKQTAQKVVKEGELTWTTLNNIRLAMLREWTDDRVTSKFRSLLVLVPGFYRRQKIDVLKPLVVSFQEMLDTVGHPFRSEDYFAALRVAKPAIRALKQKQDPFGTWLHRELRKAGIGVSP